jgi:hypothetical protein
VEDEVASATEVDVAAVHHEDEVASAIEVDVAAPADSVVVVEEAVASQEVEVVVSLPVVAVVVASVDVDVEVIKRDVLSSSSLCAPRETSDSRVFLVQGFSDCHDYYQPIPRSSFDGVLELRWGLCKSTNIWRHVGTV